MMLRREGERKPSTKALTVLADRVPAIKGKIGRPKLTFGKRPNKSKAQYENIPDVVSEDSSKENERPKKLLPRRLTR